MFYVAIILRHVEYLSYLWINRKLLAPTEFVLESRTLLKSEDCGPDSRLGLYSSLTVRSYRGRVDGGRWGRGSEADKKEKGKRQLSTYAGPDSDRCNLHGHQLKSVSGRRQKTSVVQHTHIHTHLKVQHRHITL